MHQQQLQQLPSERESAGACGNCELIPKKNKLRRQSPPNRHNRHAIRASSDPILYRASEKTAQVCVNRHDKIAEFAQCKALLNKHQAATFVACENVEICVCSVNQIVSDTFSFFMIRYLHSFIFVI